MKPEFNPSYTQHEIRLINSREDSWCGPHEGREVWLWNNNRKKAAIVAERTYKDLVRCSKEPFFYRKVRIDHSNTNTNIWVVAKSRQRLNRLYNAFSSLSSSNTLAEHLRKHAVIGIALGYRKDDVKRFVDKMAKLGHYKTTSKVSIIETGTIR